MREELAEAPEERHVFSRELSFVPRQGRPTFEAHDRQTQALIDEYKRLETLKHGLSVLGRLEEWRWMDRIRAPEEKQRFLEPLIEMVRHDPEAHQDVLVFLLIVFEPIRRGVSSRFVHAHGGVQRPTPIDWKDRIQARTIQEIERQTMFDVTREAIIQAIFLYPTPPPDKLFPWFRAVASRHALVQLKKDLTNDETGLSGAEADALQLALADLDQVAAPEMRDDAAGLGQWRRRLGLRGLYEAAGEFYRESGIATACREAIGRLPRVQGEVIEALFFREQTADQLAISRKVSRSTIYNNSLKAKNNMASDDCFYIALYQLGVLRDRTRAAEIAAKYPSGKLPDGRRIVEIDQAA
ncbi:MAG: hypothetical protein KGL15_04880 [Acidobacteriota bacterium]|nr:hypothetical protein [Acidobacteriota bacterium]